MNMKIISEILGKEFEFGAFHTGLRPAPAGDYLHDEWIITLNDQRFDYSMGIGHRKRLFPVGSFRSKYMSGDCLGVRFKDPTCQTVRSIIEHDTRPIPPTLDGVLYSLILDSEACSMTFAEWCGEFGYDEDSRKAMATYLACQENGQKLRKAGVTDLDAAREAFQDY
jgi:hypothetical protein